jgi:hypothetical protein
MDVQGRKGKGIVFLSGKITKNYLKRSMKQLMLE